MDDREAIGQAIGRIPSGLFVCSCGTGDDPVPFIASWVQQVAMDPPAISVAIARSRPGLAALDRGGAFTVSVLPQGRDDLMKPFFGTPGEDPFGGLAIRRAPSGGAYLADALAWLECRELTRASAGDHALIVGEVTAGGLLGDGEPRIHLRKTGFSY